MRREKTALLSTALVEHEGKKETHVVSYHQASIANHRFYHPDARRGRMSKGTATSQPATSSRVMGRREGILERNVRRLTTFVTARKKSTACVLAVTAGLIWFMVPLGNDATLSGLLAEQGYWET